MVRPYSLRAGVGLASREKTAELNAGACEGVELWRFELRSTRWIRRV